MKLIEFGFQKGINEVMGITFGEWINTAPLGIIVDNPESDRAKVRLYSNHTRKNIERTSRLWINIIHDPVIFAKASFEDLDESYFLNLDPPIIKGSLGWCKMDAKLRGGFADLRLLDAKIIEKEIRTVNRGFNAVIEALVHGTRFVSLKRDDLLVKVEYYLDIAEKCGGDREKRAVEIIREKLGLDV